MTFYLIHRPTHALSIRCHSSWWLQRLVRCYIMYFPLRACCLCLSLIQVEIFKYKFALARSRPYLVLSTLNRESKVHVLVCNVLIQSHKRCLLANKRHFLLLYCKRAVIQFLYAWCCCGYAFWISRFVKETWAVCLCTSVCRCLVAVVVHERVFVRLLRYLLCHMQRSNHFIVPLNDTLRHLLLLTWRYVGLWLLVNGLVLEFNRALLQGAAVVSLITCFVLWASQSTLPSDVPSVSLVVLFA